MPRSDTTLTWDCADISRPADTAIETMKTDDLDEVLAIERQSFPSVWSRES